jgi:hypothetical protein
MKTRERLWSDIEAKIPDLVQELNEEDWEDAIYDLAMDHLHDHAQHLHRESRVALAKDISKTTI